MPTSNRTTSPAPAPVRASQCPTSPFLGRGIRREYGDTLSASEPVDESWAVTLVLLGLAFAVAVAVAAWVAWVAIRFVIGG